MLLLETWQEGKQGWLIPDSPSCPKAQSMILCNHQKTQNANEHFIVQSSACSHHHNMESMLGSTLKTSLLWEETETQMHSDVLRVPGAKHEAVSTREIFPMCNGFMKLKHSFSVSLGFVLIKNRRAEASNFIRWINKDQNLIFLGYE